MSDPDPLSHPLWTDDLEVPILIHSGDVETVWKGAPIRGTGQVWLGWHPSPRVFVTWQFVDDTAGFEMLNKDRVEVNVPGKRVKATVILGGSPTPPVPGSPDTPQVVLAGFVDQMTCEPAAEIVEAHFLIVNGPELLGNRLARPEGGFWLGRTVLQTKGWVFTIDQRSEIGLGSDVRWAPFALTHKGSLVNADGSALEPQEVAEALEFLGWFLSFVRGAAVSAILAVGTDRQGDAVWEEWGSANQRVDPARGTLSWFDRSLTHRLQALVEGFESRWTTTHDREVLKYAIGLYLGANNPQPLQTGLTLAVSGLELMAWVYLVRDGTMSEREFDKQGERASTFKELLSRVDVDVSRVPTSLPALKKSGQLGPDAIWRLRRQISHPRLDRRPADPDLTIDAWRISTWYLELVMLHWFGYAGSYGSRLKERWMGDVDPVPWQPSG